MYEAKMYQVWAKVMKNSKSTINDNEKSGFQLLQHFLKNK